MSRWWILLMVLLVVVAHPYDVGAQAACTHYASPNGTGGSCSEAQPCLINSFWSIGSLPGKVLCLNDGTYTGGNSMITPPAGIQGTSGNPITVRALHDGLVLIDAEHGGSAVSLAWHGGEASENSWFVVEGINARNGLVAIYTVSGSDNIVRRSIGWDGTSGEQNSFGFDITGYRSRAEDVAAWGMNLRKVFNASQVGDQEGGGVRRAWGEWNDHTQGESFPMSTFQAGYGSRNQLWENILGTWNTLGDLSVTKEGALSIFCGGCNPGSNSVAGTKVLGSVLYIAPGASFAPEMLVWTLDSSDITMQDIAMVVPPGYSDKRPFYIFPGCTSTCTGNTCTNCLAVHDGTPGLDSPSEGWTMPGLLQGNGLAAATGGTSAFVLLPGICRQYQDGVLTDTPLWPWPMNQRILDARAAGGFLSVDVTAQMESILGTIPSQCRTDTVPSDPQPNITGGAHAEPGKGYGRYGGFQKRGEPCDRLPSGCGSK